MILYEDDALLVVHKPAGIATETARIGQADIVSMLKGYRSKKGENTYIGVVHRLDQPVEGLLVFAKDTVAAKDLSDGLRSGSLIKEYAVLVAGIPGAPEGELTDYLLKDGRTNLSKAVPKGTKGAKEARLCWRIQSPAENGFFLPGCARLAVGLFTGRHHQIRVQLSHAGYPILGDMKYGSEMSRELSARYGICRIALVADRLTLTHPVTKQCMTFALDDPFPQEMWRAATNGVPGAGSGSDDRP